LKKDRGNKKWRKLLARRGVIVNDFFCSVDKNPVMVCFMRRIRTQIDQMVYKLYDLTPEEIAIVEGGIE
jgi:hypothetical protein